MWRLHGLINEPKIVFRETKQIIPDKKLFGYPKFVSNAFDVEIQLARVAKVQDHAAKGANKDVNISSNEDVDKIEIKYVRSPSDNIAPQATGVPEQGGEDESGASISNDVDSEMEKITVEGEDDNGHTTKLH